MHMHMYMHIPMPGQAGERRALPPWHAYLICGHPPH